MNKTNVTTILLPTSMHSFLFSPTAQKVAQPLASNAAVTSSTIRLTHSRYILAEGYTPSHVIKEASVAPFLEIAVISTYLRNNLATANVANTVGGCFLLLENAVQWDELQPKLGGEQRIAFVCLRIRMALLGVELSCPKL